MRSIRRERVPAPNTATQVGPLPWQGPRTSQATGSRWARSRRGPCSIRGKLVLRFRFEVSGVVALVQLARRLARGAVDHPPALYRRPLVDLVRPALDVLVVLHAEELGGAVLPELRQPAVPGPDRDVGDSVGRAGDILAFREPAIEHIEQALRLHCEAVDRI